MASSHLLRLVIAFAAVYLVWGSTYYAIAIVIETMPPFAAASARFVVAGTVVLLWCAIVGRTMRQGLTLKILGRAALVGTLMLAGGNGLVVWAIAHGAPTGLTAVIVATTPFWLVGLDRLVDRTQRIAPSTIVGLCVGFVGIVILAAPGRAVPVAGLSVTALAAVLLATLSWAFGSIISRAGSRVATSADSADPLVLTGIQMVVGGAALGVWSTLSEDLSAYPLASITARSWLAHLYLIVFGSIVAYTAFIWLLRHVSAAAVGTYAYVNPIVALGLGVGLNAEPLTARAILASSLILGAVATISVVGQHGRRSAARKRTRVAVAAAAPPEVPPIPLRRD